MKELPGLASFTPWSTIFLRPPAHLTVRGGRTLCPCPAGPGRNSGGWLILAGDRFDRRLKGVPVETAAHSDRQVESSATHRALPRGPRAPRRRMGTLEYTSLLRAPSGARRRSLPPRPPSWRWRPDEGCEDGLDGGPRRVLSTAVAEFVRWVELRSPPLRASQGVLGGLEQGHDA